jgi:hypothetical protein
MFCGVNWGVAIIIRSALFRGSEFVVGDETLCVLAPVGIGGLFGDERLKVSVVAPLACFCTGVTYVSALI